MKVILLENIDRLGTRGQVVTVKDGYARNFLLPRGLALRATPAQMKQLSALQRQLATKEEKTRQRLAGLAEKLGQLVLKAELKMGEEGAFGAITNADICELLAQQGYKVDRHSIVLEDPIKHPGTYDIPVKLGHEVVATVKVWVTEVSPSSHA